MAYSSTKTKFLTEDFLLQNDFAKILYQNYAKDLPIIDYHNHLSPAEIANDRKFNTISEAWLAGDHYKWRAMRTFGINEKYITGNASDEEKFDKWAETVPYTLRNPLFHWTQLELQRYFGVDELLCAANSREIYTHCNRLLNEDNFTAQGLLGQMKVETVCTTDDPTDSLEFHSAFSGKNPDLAMYPAFRPDKSFAVENPKNYLAYLKKLGDLSGTVINTFDDLLVGLQNRVEYFHSKGGRVADHGLEQLYYFDQNAYSIDSLFKELMLGNTLAKEEINFFKFKVLAELSKMYHAKGWVQQYHLGGLRNTNERMLSTLGPDTGFDSIGDFDQAMALSKFLNHLDSTDQLTKTILYNLNPRDNEVMATMIGNFNDGSTRGKIQFGSGWWYMDQKDGMERQMNTLSNMGLISCFVGMLTDSRSFLSFPRHEYFRRILCNLIAKDVVEGQLPWDEKWLGGIIADICYHNAKAYFDFNPKNIQS